jgi:hypothetical protein
MVEPRLTSTNETINETMEKTKVNQMEQIEKVLKENGWVTPENTSLLAAEGTCSLACASSCMVCRSTYT